MRSINSNITCRTNPLRAEWPITALVRISTESASANSHVTQELRDRKVAIVRTREKRHAHQRDGESRKHAPRDEP